MTARTARASPWVALVAAMACLAQGRVWLQLARAALPVLGGVGLLGWALWQPVVAAVQALLASVAEVPAIARWMPETATEALRAVLAPGLALVLALPLVLLLALWAVAWLAMPGLVDHIAARRHPGLVRRSRCGPGRRLAWAAGTSGAAVLALALSLPLWLVPPLVLVLPPLLWGWLAARLLAYQAVAFHASASERRRFRRGLVRSRTLGLMGLATGYLALAPAALAPAALLGSEWLDLAQAPMLLLGVAALWVLVFGLAAAWFAHFSLDELARFRQGLAATGRSSTPQPEPESNPP